MAADQTLGVEVEGPAAKIAPADDPEVVMYDLEFRLLITNRGKEAVDIGGDPIDVHAVQNRERDGTWSYLSQSTIIHDETTKYPACYRLGPGEKRALPTVHSGLVLLKQQADKLGGAATLRFLMQIFCTARDGTTKGTAAFFTEPVNINLPPTK